MNAFPIVLPKDWEGYEDGMTLRDYFAGQALIGITPVDISYTQMAERAYYIADAMLEARGE
jgi:hypothetical protein